MLRTVDDAIAVRRGLAPGARLVVIGAGFIGAEVASTAAEYGPGCRRWFEAALGRSAGPLGVQLLAARRGHTAGRRRAGPAVVRGWGLQVFISNDWVAGVELADGVASPAT